MALPVNRPLNIVRVFSYNADISTAGSSFSTMPVRGKIVLLGCVIHAAVTTAPNVLTAKIGVSGSAGTAITIPTWTQSHTSSAAGVVSEVVPSGANLGDAGNNIEFISDGAGSGTVPATYYADILVS
ncbi:hypothetical protein JQ628_11355 [Bradyrhizobium lablabi]|uniref:hypothetical protein n=1 Tax=Bradyrhizobium lablabi TaxID=722472 RepID=UPI001BA44049|nr:hypothetical protein [Bradyrhizobium lablabi]MBR1122113.1 hypothetical protein [Bradyrhizobium lablabi]